MMFGVGALGTAPFGSLGGIIFGPFESYARSPYSAYTGMWGVYLTPPLTDYSADMRIAPSFPNGTVFSWTIGADTPARTNGFLHVDFGNYDDSPGVITPRQVYTITSLAVAMNWTFSGDDSTGLLGECWLSDESAPSGSFDKNFEVGVLPKISASAQTYVAGLTSVGSGYTDSNGIDWQVVIDTSLTPPDIIAYRSGYASFVGTFDMVAYFAYLVAEKQITGNEWFNGFGFGPEPYAGSGSVTVNTYAITYAGAARVPWTITDLAATAQSDSEVLLTFTPAPGASNHQYQVDGGAWTACADNSGSQAVSGLSAATAYTFAVRGVNGTGAGDASNTASVTTQTAGASNILNAANWSGGGYSGMSISGGSLEWLNAVGYDGFSQSGLAPVAAKYYELTYTVSGYAKGSLRPFLNGGTMVNGAIRSANGTYVERLLAATGNNALYFQSETDGTNTNTFNIAEGGITLVGPYDTATVGGS